ncbi:hypothetical protein EYC59_01770 [Candidatus Saccharibacteria bacterium]|nr:MAG: hypothetical protein EYC59_01770 [Candidatus Saccharibacteria bacterium]
MKIKYLTHARSPFWQLLFSLESFALMLVLLGANPPHQGVVDLSVNLEQQSTLALLIILAIIVLLSCLLYGLAIQRYNAAHPRAKMRWFRNNTPEIFTQDERLQSLSAHATQRVYRYHSVALPLLALAFFLVRPDTFWAIIFLAIFTIGHYITYLRHSWVALDD